MHWTRAGYCVPFTVAARPKPRDATYPKSDRSTINRRVAIVPERLGRLSALAKVAGSMQHAQHQPSPVTMAAAVEAIQSA